MFSVALIGRQNVGKSTLFNRLTHTNDAIVANFPGLTRDLRYGYAQWRGQRFIVIDTAGFDSTEETIKVLVLKKSLQTIIEANIILFLVDSRIGPTEDDQNIAKHLRCHKKATIVVANKSDGVDIDSTIGNFYSLGIRTVLPISASSGRGIGSLLDEIFLLKEEMCKTCNAINISAKIKKRCFSFKKSSIKIAVVGRPNVGKSTLVNSLLEEERVVVCQDPGTTRDSVYTVMMRNEDKYLIIDTAGVRKQKKVIKSIEKFSFFKTLQAIKDANVVILVMNACEGCLRQDLLLLNLIINRGRSLVIAVNKWDKLSKTEQHNFKKSLKCHINFINLHVHFISALYGYGINNLITTTKIVYSSSVKKVSTKLLTNIMHAALIQHQPPLVNGHCIKPKYAHIGGYNPLLVVIHGVRVKDIPSCYGRYLRNYFCRALKVTGTPIRIKYHEN